MKKLLIVLLGLVVSLPCMLVACAPEEIRALRSAHRVVAGEILSVERVSSEDRSVTYSIKTVVREVLLGSPMRKSVIRVRMELWDPKEDPSYEKGKSYVLYLRKDPAEGETVTWSVKYGTTSVQSDTESLREKLGTNSRKKDRSYEASQDGVDVSKLSALERKMHGIIIPEMDFMCANVYDILDFFHMASIDFGESSPDDQKGVNMCLNGRSFAGDRIPLINFYSEDMSLLQALDLVVALAEAERTTIDDWIIVTRKSDDSLKTAPIVKGDSSPLSAVLQRLVLREVDFRQAAVKDVAEFLSETSGVDIAVSGSPDEIAELAKITLTGKHTSVLTLLKVLGVLTPMDIRIGEKKVILGPATTSRPTQTSGPVVGHLKTRDRVITIRSGAAGPLYTVKAEDGTILASDLPADELAARFPDLKQVVQGGIADWAGTTTQPTVEVYGDWRR
jgi:hypothetical protein